MSTPSQRETPPVIVKPELTPHERRVKEMMIGFGQDTPHNPTALAHDAKTRKARVRFLLEEVLELAEAEGVTVALAMDDGTYMPFDHGDARDGRIRYDENGDEPDLEKIVDALTDISVVNTGAFIAHGVRVAPMLEITDSNNLLKIANGKLNPETGKFEKAPNHPVPNYAFALRVQGYMAAKDYDRVCKEAQQEYPPASDEEVQQRQGSFLQEMRDRGAVPLFAKFPDNESRQKFLQKLDDDLQAEKAAAGQVVRSSGTNMRSEVGGDAAQHLGFNTNPQAAGEHAYDRQHYPDSGEVFQLFRQGAYDLAAQKMAASIAGSLGGDIRRIDPRTLRLSPPGQRTAIYFKYEENKDVGATQAAAEDQSPPA